MISALFFLSGRGEVLISRIYRDDVPKGAADAFRQHVVQSKDSNVPPVVFVNGASYMWVKSDQVYLVSITKENVNASMVFEFLQKLLNLLKMYFVSDKVTEEAIRGKFVLIYELLDEIMDFGYPQNCEYEILKQYILEGGGEGVGPNVQDQKKITAQATGAVTWRGPNVKYRKNEIFLDVVENVNLLMSQTGTVLRSDVSGQVLVKCYLSGMPELKFGLNDKLVMEKEKDGAKRKSTAIEIDDMQFHQCVRLGKFDTDRTISFIPPDGEFELMKYRTTENINLPFKVLSNIKEHGRARLDVKVSIKAQFGADLAASNVVVRIPTPKNTALCRIAPTTGKAKYDPTTGGIVWKIRRFAGDSELSLSAEVELLSSTGTVAKPWSRPPIAMEFQVPMFAASGLKVRFLKIYEKSNYPSVKWVRYLTKGGVYETRI
eukprot:c4329_g1_i1.p1 GENE.c4329_g1_i1~~c4329_g1_i1.p1  ORF type:complete len:432 (+),score=1.99 c4329_g1_i1:95-1390(+)